VATGIDNIAPRSIDPDARTRHEVGALECLEGRQALKLGIACKKDLKASVYQGSLYSCCLEATTDARLLFYDKHRESRTSDL
jgi:hypothetical protein